jgi:methionyl-tRNA formyltransferase
MAYGEMKFVFFGTSEFGAIILGKLIQAGIPPDFVVSTPDRPAGRGYAIRSSPVKIVAQKHGIIVRENLEGSKPDLIVLAAYGKILPKDILDIPKKGALNVHPSLLPKYRGPSPVQATILQGEKTTGVSIILMDEEIDHGPIVANSKFQIPNSKIVYPELHDKLAEIGADLFIKTIPEWIEGKIEPKPQDHAKATFTKKISKEDGRIDWTKPAEYIERQVRAFYPWPSAFTFWKGKRIKILKAHVEQRTLIIDELQLEGKKPTTLQDFLLGHKDFTLP